MDDAPVTLAMLDDAVAWLTSRGRSGQWGSEPWSTQPERVERVHGLLRDSDVWVAEIDGEPAGVLGVSARPHAYVPAADEPELYVTLLVGARAFAGRGVGRALLDHARDEARRRGVWLLRVDCWAGGDGQLVRYYVGAGFTPTVRVQVGDWQGQVLEQRLTDR
jgi:GNAT superfamily N-acetyltransferase